MKNAEARYLSRDLSWIDFNERVLEEGLRHDLLPLDRLKFLTIVSSNFDEFFMVRVAAIKRARDKPLNAESVINELNAELETIKTKVKSIIDRQYAALREEIMPDLAKGGLVLARPADWTADQREFLESLFREEYLPLLTPLRVENNEPLPAIENFWIHAAFLLSKNNEEKISIVRIPEVLGRIIMLGPQSPDGISTWALLDDLVLEWGHYLFSGYEIREQLLFRVNRDADFSVDEQRDEDFIEAMEEVLIGRGKSNVIRMVYSPGSSRLRDYSAGLFNINEGDHYEIDGPLNLDGLYDLVQMPGFDHLREKPWKIYDNPAFSGDTPIWDRIRESDVILHLPYQGFDPVVRFFRDAASDPNVVSIKTTLYRTSEKSPIVRALEQASLAGKHVTAIVELKARFDERQNISWANRLEKAGVIVVYGLAHLKVHAKAALIIRRENERLRRYVHLSTGNYNENTAKFYEDISLFSCRDEIAYETGLIFNMVTGYSVIQTMRRLIVAPMNLKKHLLNLIEREINHSNSETPGKIMAKLNSLADMEIINALYKASQAGVKISLNVRGICLLIPGIPGISENINVIGIIDHYLEHSRICYFAKGGNEELFLSSADWMPRNMERRIELMFPVIQEDAKNSVLGILKSYFRDNTHAWRLDNKGVWTRIGKKGETAFRAQTEFLAMAEKAARAAEGTGTANTGFIIRRSPS